MQSLKKLRGCFQDIQRQTDTKTDRNKNGKTDIWMDRRGPRRVHPLSKNVLLLNSEGSVDVIQNYLNPSSSFTRGRILMGQKSKGAKIPDKQNLKG